MTRIHLTGPHFRRTQPSKARLWLDVKSPLPGYSAYVIRSEYRRLREGGLSAFTARIVVYQLLDIGRHTEKGENYR